MSEPTRPLEALLPTEYSGADGRTEDAYSMKNPAVPE